MSERNEKLPSKNEPLKIRSLLKRLLNKGGKKDHEDNSDSEEFRRQRADARPAGPGLKDHELDLEQYHTSAFTASGVAGRAPNFFHTLPDQLEQYYKSNPDRRPSTNSTHEQDDNPFVSLMYSSAILSRTTNELDKWLYEHTPQNGYFTPEMVVEAVADNPDVHVNQQVEDGLDVWRFTDDKGHSIALSRTHDGSQPNVPTTPYLFAIYWPEYDSDTHEVVLTPKLAVNKTSLNKYKDLQSGLADTISQALGLHETRIKQEIEFRVIDEKPVPYLTAGGTSSLESVVAGAHVVADLPHID